jgi:hypothetical protein
MLLEFYLAQLEPSEPTTPLVACSPQLPLELDVLLVGRLGVLPMLLEECDLLLVMPIFLQGENLLCVLRVQLRNPRVQRASIRVKSRRSFQQQLLLFARCLLNQFVVLLVHLLLKQ